MLELEGIDCHYAKVHVLRGVSLVVNRGEIVSMIGPNAAGKTTTLRVMAGLKQPSAGRIRYLGEDITRLLPFERVRRGLVLVPEGRQIFPKFTVLDNLRLADRAYLLESGHISLHGTGADLQKTDVVRKLYLGA